MANGYADPRVTLLIGDGLKFMGGKENEYDVIITDSSDPVGPAESLFGEAYYKLVKKALREGGIACSQVIKHNLSFIYSLFAQKKVLSV